jgi:hypothetical protein
VRTALNNDSNFYVLGSARVDGSVLVAISISQIMRQAVFRSILGSWLELKFEWGRGIKVDWNFGLKLPL